jgi:general secretion pathway protein I
VIDRQVTARRGFTLLEMMVATTIMGVAVVGLLSQISTSVHNAARLRDYDRVAQLAREQMNSLLADYNMPRNVELNNEFDPRVTGGLAVGWRSQLTTFEKPESPTGALALDRIQLQVWWDSSGKRRTIYLESFRKRWTTPQDFQQVGGQQ